MSPRFPLSLSRKAKTWIVVGLTLLAVLGIGPLIVPLPPLPNTVPPQELADADSRFTEVAGLQLHYKIAGRNRPALLLLHGFGASLFSWHKTMPRLAENGTVVAFDRPAFGLTERPLPGSWEGPSPYSVPNQITLTVGLMDQLGLDQAILVGHSAGGAIAALTALEHPDRVTALILVDPAVYTQRKDNLLTPLLDLPQVRRLGPLAVRNIQSWGDDFIRQAWHDPTRLTQEDWDGYHKPLNAVNWDIGLWEMSRATQATDLTDRLDELQLPVLVIAGDDDRIVPTADSIRLGHELPNAQLVILPGCGHNPQEECSEAFLQAVTEFIGRLPQ